MKKVLFISGSGRAHSANLGLIRYLISKLNIQGQVFDLKNLPIFYDGLQDQKPEVVRLFELAVDESDIVLISTPEYLKGIPALLKNALEWVANSGVLEGKKIIGVCFVPNNPRGEGVLASLQKVLLALNANILFLDIVYQNDFFEDKIETKFSLEFCKMIGELMDLK